MRRIISVLLLTVPAALLAWGCEATDQAGGVAGPDLKPSKPCTPWPECNKPDGEDGHYTRIDLSTPRRADGLAHDVSEPVGGLLNVVGWIQKRGSPDYAVVWSGAPEELDNVDPVVLPIADYHVRRAFGINDDASLIVGRLNTKAEPFPAVWAAAGGDWDTGVPLAPLGTDSNGVARDVNVFGKIVGWIIGSSGTVATSWASPEAMPAVLPSPASYTVSLAYDLNNAGWIAGEISDPLVERSSRAVLWGPGGEYCDLHPGGQTESTAYGVDEVQGTMVLVAGTALPAMRPVVWTVDVTSCDFTFEIVDIYAGAATDVRHLAGGWEAIGTDDEFFRGRPAWWTSGEESEFLYEKQGRAYAINGAGHCVGWRDQSGPKPSLWVPAGN